LRARLSDFGSNSGGARDDAPGINGVSRKAGPYGIPVIQRLRRETRKWTGPICGLGVAPTAAERPNLARRIGEAPIEQAEPPPHRRLSPRNQPAILSIELTPPAIAGVGHGACPTGAGGPLFRPGWLPPWCQNNLTRALSGSIFRRDKSPTSTGSVEDPAASRQLNSRYGQNAWTYPRIWSGQVQSARDVRRSIFS